MLDSMFHRPLYLTAALVVLYVLFSRKESRPVEATLTDYEMTSLAPLKLLQVAARAKHSATVIFVHVSDKNKLCFL